MIRLAVLDGLVLSYARALQKQNINYQEYLLVDVTDISDICVYMTYIQLALYGVPAIVRCGNTLTQEMRFKLETPLFFLHYSKFRKFLIKEGFIMMQESVYSKLTLNNSITNAIRDKIEKNKPPKGIVQMLVITEKQFSSMEYIVRRKNI